MKFGVRRRSYKKSFSAMTTGRLKRSVKRQVIPGYGRKGVGWVKNPKKAAYNAVYHRTTVKSPLPYLGTPVVHNTKRHAGNAPQAAPMLNTNIPETIATSSKALTITSSNFEQLKQDLTEVYENRATLKRRLAKAQGNYYLTFLFSSKEKRQAKKAIIDQLQDDIEHAYINLNFRKNMKDPGSWDETSFYFQELLQSHKVWDLTTRQDTDKFHQRTIADESVDRKPITTREHQTLEFIHADADNLYLPNLNGEDLYVYPTFIVLFKNYKQFSIHDLRQVNIAATGRSFHEEDGVPTDSEVVGQTYKYTNKNGQPDRRYSNNYTIPVAQYGDLRLFSDAGINERYMFSNFKKFAEFAQALKRYASTNLKMPVEG